MGKVKGYVKVTKIKLAVTLVVGCVQIIVLSVKTRVMETIRKD
jgi:hypothetical protein